MANSSEPEWKRIAKGADLKITDGIIMALALYTLAHIDYGNLGTIDIVYLIIFPVWFLSLGIRLWVACRNTRQ